MTDFIHRKLYAKQYKTTLNKDWKSILFYLCYTAYHMSLEYSMAIQYNTLGYKTPINVTRSLTIWPYKQSLL